MDRTKSLKPALIRLGIAAILLALSAGFLYSYRQQQRNQEVLYDIKVIPPTCTENGYSLYTNRENGATFVDDLVPATGHSYSQWTEDSPSGTLDSWTRSRSCSSCELTETEFCYPDLPLPRLALEGELTGIGKETEVNMTADFASDETSFSVPASLKYQGHESLLFEKKNYTLKLYEDENRSQKHKISFSHWNLEHKYILKANFIDPSQCRNLICADIWADMVAARENVPEKFRELSNFGAVDGFPIVLYMNGQFQGLYTLNLHKDDDLFGMSDGEEEAILITNHAETDEAYFRSEAAFSDDSPWEVEFCGTEDTRWAEDQLNSLISFVRESDDAAFHSDLHKYLDVESAIDYLLCIYACGLSDNGASNLVLVTYGKGDPWIASIYDMENAFGLAADGSEAMPAAYFLPVKSNDGWDSGTGSLLWDRLLDNFLPEIQSRYALLRSTVLIPEDLCQRVLTYSSSISSELYQADAALYAYPSDMDQISQITQYITQRIDLLDEIFGK